MSKKNKSIGILRHLDDLGRVVIPKEFRRVMGLESGDPVELQVNRVDGQMMLQVIPYHCLDDLTDVLKTTTRAMVENLPNNCLVIASDYALDLAFGNETCHDGILSTVMIQHYGPVLYREAQEMFNHNRQKACKDVVHFSHDIKINRDRIAADVWAYPLFQENDLAAVLLLVAKEDDDLPASAVNTFTVMAKAAAAGMGLNNI